MRTFDEAVADGGAARWGGVAPLLSGLCFVHCVGLAVLAPIVPGAVGLFARASWIEPCLFFVSVAASGATLRRARVRRRSFAVWGLNVVVGLWGMVRDVELLTQLSLGAMVVLQLVMAMLRWRGQRGACGDCGVCTDERSGT